jgi:hypothetical protein
MKRMILAALSLALVACSPTPQEAPTQETPPPAASAQPRLAPHGEYDAISNTAMGVTGALTLSADALRFEKGQAYATTQASVVPSSANYAQGEESWTELLQVPAEASVEIRHVTSAQGGSICGADAVTFLALAEGENGALKIAAFKGEPQPGPEADVSANLCATFYYALKTPAPAAPGEDPSQAAN